MPPAAELADNQFQMMTIRSEGQFNTVVYDEEDLYRGQDRRAVVLPHPADIEPPGLQPDQPARVYNETGEMRYQLVRPFYVLRCNALMYCPEANVLISRDIDPESKTPAFKSIRITIEPEA